MIVGIYGEIVNKFPTFVELKTQSGLIYKVDISLHTSSMIDQSNITLHTTYVVKEDSQRLFGFSTLEEKDIFDRVLKINGVGPSTALAICSTLTPEEFFKALSAGSIDSFKKVPGIGPKSAKRILVELGDFTPSIELVPSEKDKAIEALESLGFKNTNIKKALKDAKSSSVEDLIKEALRVLS